jgi:hypothetical protein
MLNGYTFPNFWPFKGYVLKPILTKIHIPPIIMMIVMGCVVRNFFGEVEVPYNNVWAQWIRTCCLAILLVRGGMNVSFTGKGILVLVMTFVPLMFEATTLALIGLGLFNMPIEIAYSLGFAVGSVAPAIVVP